MTCQEVEPAIDLDTPQISPKTSHKQLQEFSNQRWTYDGRRRVAADIVKNGIELLAGSNINWELVLRSIRREQQGSAQVGVAAIAAYDAYLIGALGVTGGWSMNDPAIVYLSGKCLANRASDKFEDFKIRMRQAAVAYGKKVLPDADLYMETLDFLLEPADRNKYRPTIKKVTSLLGKGNIEEAYRIVKSRDDLVRKRG